MSPKTRKGNLEGQNPNILIGRRTQIAGLTQLTRGKTQKENEEKEKKEIKKNKIRRPSACRLHVAPLPTGLPDFLPTCSTARRPVACSNARQPTLLPASLLRHPPA
ncbi:hypothetical protein MRB53_028776 [Persea americana]|uniref:Uncharacterized protein n=1 Tax=Persea americana TaxID=3435 RepID=A0ACC2KGF6_PERAE|nr:hypothetical protein MRB53_028776 [Persea americana]